MREYITWYVLPAVVRAVSWNAFFRRTAAGNAAVIMLQPYPCCPVIPGPHGGTLLDCFCSQFPAVSTQLPVRWKLSL